MTPLALQRERGVTTKHWARMVPLSDGGLVTVPDALTR
jgi:hypothetical protein